MRHILFILSLTAMTACGGGETPAEEPKAEEPKAEEPKAEEPKAEEPKAAEPDLSAMSDEEKLAALIKAGEEVYNKGGTAGMACVTCHQANGEGMDPAFPPLKGSKEEMGDCTQHAKQVIFGQTGKIVVQGKEYDGAMPPLGANTDFEIAAVITYERNAWGNDYGVCLPEVVKAARAK